MTNRILRAQLRQPGTFNAEPTLAELIDDPVLHAVMAGDGVGCADLVGAIDTARARLGLGPWVDAPCGPASASGPVCCA